ncbi:VCBS repeat-containing protein [Crystallibacter crystallopoietes]|uniref:VCBS repeat-containing protein n=1 Tax=Crystallibacter crystallopoietes TaxID=37928 RepID=UPI0002FA6F53|nr:Ig-like domain-containing protein [Arthrobacter crystallopoietes]
MPLAHQAKPNRRRPFKRLATTATAAAVLAAAFAPLSIAPAQAELPGAGPIDPANGYPMWYSDGTVRLQFCYTAELGCLSTPPNAGPASYPDNFPDEAFWYAATADIGDIGSYEAALEGAHANEAVVDGDQIGFARLRFRLTGLVDGATYTITHPYGVHTFEAVAGNSGGEINETIDAGECTPGACDWDGVGRAFLGDYGNGTTATFLRQVNPPAGKIGDPNVATAVTGAPSGNNFVRVDGPNAGGPGINTITASSFAVQGVISDTTDGAPSMPDLAAASDSGSSSTDNITNNTTPTFTGSAADGSTVELLVDGAVAGSAVATGGNYSIPVTAALAEGPRRVTARIANPASPADPTAAAFLTSGELAMTVDTTPATVTFGSGLPSNPSLTNTPSFNFSTTENGATFECQLLYTNSAWGSCATGKTYDAQRDGIYTFNVRSVDRAGNVGAPASHAWRIGEGEPVAAVSDEQKDMNGDGNPDMVARSSDGKLWLYPGNGSGRFSSRFNIGTGGWNAMTAILMPGDFNRDGDSDVIARDGNGVLWLYPGAGNGGLERRQQIGTGWNSITALVAPGDFDGDGSVDLLARSSTGQLLLYPNHGGRFGAAPWREPAAGTP